MAGTPDIDGLREFSRESDRHLTPFFAGRAAELEQVRWTVDGVRSRVAEGAPAPAEGRLTLITGVPGAGKTSLMARLEQDWRAEGESAPLPARIDLEDLANEHRFVRILEQQIADRRFRNLLSHVSGITVTAGPVSVGLGSPAPGSLAELPDRGRPVVLFIDEIQNLPLGSEGRADPDSLVAQRLKGLQSGVHGYPVIPVAAGLAHATDRLDQAGLSRLAAYAVLPLGCLSPDEARQSMALFFDRYRVTGDRESWTETVIRRSYGWPKHVQNSQMALARELAGCDGNLDGVDRTEVRRRTAQLRVRYYLDRMSGVLGGVPLLVGRVMEAIGPVGADKRTCINLIVGANRPESGDVGAMIPEELGSAAAMFDAMVAKGLLQPDVMTNVFHCPIPSMRSWCATLAGGRLHASTAAALRDDVETALGRGDDPDARDLRSRTPLHIAAEENWPEIAALLLAAGADPDVRDNLGRTPLAAAGERETEVRALLEAGPPARFGAVPQPKP